MDGWIHGYIHGFVDTWINGWIDLYVFRCTVFIYVYKTHNRYLYIYMGIGQNPGT
jgi:hypothetical protein